MNIHFINKTEINKHPICYYNNNEKGKIKVSKFILATPVISTFYFVYRSVMHVNPISDKNIAWRSVREAVAVFSGLLGTVLFPVTAVILAISASIQYDIKASHALYIGLLAIPFVSSVVVLGTSILHSYYSSLSFENQDRNASEVDTLFPYPTVISDLDDTVWPSLFDSNKELDNGIYHGYHALVTQLKGEHGRECFVTAGPNIPCLQVECKLKRANLPYEKILYGNLIYSIIAILGFPNKMIKRKCRQINDIAIQTKGPLYFLGDMGQHDFDVILETLKSDTPKKIDIAIFHTFKGCRNRIQEVPIQYKDKIFFVDHYQEAIDILSKTYVISH